jgi:hypothetical protein
VNDAGKQKTEIFFQNANKIFKENLIQNYSIDVDNKYSSFLVHMLCHTFHPLNYSLADVKH